MWQVYLLPSLVLFVLGSVIGSFFNVVVLRTLNGKSWLWGRSKCDHCQRTINWYDNIPIFSYLYLRGKCRFCQREIGLSHIVLEILMGLLFVWWYLVGFLFFQISTQPLQTLQALFWLSVGIILLLILVIDYLYLIIPDFLVLSLMALTLIYRLALIGFGVMQVSDFFLAILGMTLSVVGFGLLYLITKGKGMGRGDIKLVAPLSLLMGWPDLWAGLFLAFSLGAIMGLILISLRKKHFGQVIAFGPFLVIGTFLSLLWGNNLVSWYLTLL